MTAYRREQQLTHPVEKVGLNESSGDYKCT